MQNNTENQVYAGFFVRLAAYIIDWIIVGCVLLVVKFPLWIATVASPDNFIVKDFIFSYSVKDIVLYLLGVLYFILLTYFTGATLGKRAMRLRVVSSEQRKMTLFEVAYRETVGRFLSKIIIFIRYTRVVYYHVREVEIPPTVVYRESAPIYSNGPMQGQMVNEQKSDF